MLLISVNPKRTQGKELDLKKSISQARLFLNFFNPKLAPILGLAIFYCSSVFSITVTETLPYNVRASGLVYINSQTVTDTFNEKGRLEPLAGPLNQRLTMKDLVSRDPRLQTLQNALNGFGPYALGDDLISVDLKGDVKVSEQRQIIALLYGITDKFTLGFYLPVVQRTTEATFSANVFKNTDNVRKALGQIPKALMDALDEVDRANLGTDFFLNEIFYKNGYKAPGVSNRSGIGDLELESRYRFFRSRYFDSAFRFTGKFPTGDAKTDIANIFDKPLGQGALSFKAGAYADTRIIPGLLSFNNALSVTVYEPSETLRAIRRDANSQLPNLNDPYQIERVKKNTGADLKFESGLMVDFWKGALNISTTYVYESHGQDRYAGARDLLYSTLSENTSSRLHSLETSLEFSSIPLYLDKKAPLPGKIVLTWNQPLGGQNIPLAAYGRVDLVLLF